MPAVTEAKQGQDMVIMVKVQKPPYACINQGRLIAEDSRAGRLSVVSHLPESSVASVWRKRSC